MSTNRESLRRVIGEMRHVKQLKLSELIDDVLVYVKEAEFLSDYVCDSPSFGSTLIPTRRRRTQPSITIDYGDGHKLVLVPEQPLVVPNG